MQGVTGHHLYINLDFSEIVPCVLSLNMQIIFEAYIYETAEQSVDLTLSVQVLQNIDIRGLG